MSTDLPSATWFGPTDRPLLGWWHVPASGSARGTVIIVPPLGREYVLAHHAFRHLAQQCRDLGLATLRFDLAGTGDSAGGDDDPALAEEWVASVRHAVTHAREAGSTHVTLVGMRVGATLAAHVAAEPGVDALVLWDPCTGRNFLREQRALLRLGVTAASSAPEGAVEIPGSHVAAATVEGLRTLDATVPRQTCPVLLLVRPDTQPPQPLADALGGTVVTRGEAAGQPELIGVDAAASRVPQAACDLIESWVQAQAPSTAVPLSPTIVTSRTVTGPDGPVLETLRRLGPVHLFGILTEPVGRPAVGPVILLINNTTEHHIGPARQWVRLARAWGTDGLRVLRLDMSGLGDSPPRPGLAPQRVYAPEAFDDLEDAARAVSPEDPGAIVVGGLCSGAYQAMESAVALKAAGAIIINPVPWVEPPETAAGGLDPRRRAIRREMPGVRRIGNHPVLAGLKDRVPSWLWELFDLLGVRGSPAAAFRTMVRTGVDTFVAFGEFDAEPYRRRAPRLLRRLTRTGRFTLMAIPDLDHSILAASPREAAMGAVREHVVRHFAADGAGPA